MNGSLLSASAPDVLDGLRELVSDLHRGRGTPDGEDLNGCRGCEAQSLVDTLDARLLRLSQALRLLRDTSGEYVGNVAQRALDEAGIPEPPEEDHP